MEILKFPIPPTIATLQKPSPIRNQVAIHPKPKFNVTRKEPRLIFPEKPTPVEKKQLSDMDNWMNNRVRAPIIFFYNANPKMADIDPAEVVSNAIAKALVYYYPLAGRLFCTERTAWASKVGVDCAGSDSGGVVFVEADADAEIRELGDDVFPHSPLVRELLYIEETMKENEFERIIVSGPILSFQVTRFKCGGFCLGLVYHHAVTDGYGVSLFMKAMSELIRGATIPSTLPVWERHHHMCARSPPQVKNVEKFYHDPTVNPYASRKAFVTELNSTAPMTLFMKHQHLQALRDRHGLHSCTKYELLTACLWKFRTMISKPHPDETTRVTCLTSARFALRHIPKGFYGNAVVNPSSMCSVKELLAKPMEEVIELVKKTKSLGMKEEFVKSTIDHIATKPSTPVITLNTTTTDVSFAESNKDFGWGDPAIGSVGNIPLFTAYYNRSKTTSGEDGTIISLRVQAECKDELKRLMMIH